MMTLRKTTPLFCTTLDELYKNRNITYYSAIFLVFKEENPFISPSLTEHDLIKKIKDIEVKLTKIKLIGDFSTSSVFFNITKFIKLYNGQKQLNILCKHFGPPEQTSFTFKLYLNREVMKILLIDRLNFISCDSRTIHNLNYVLKILKYTKTLQKLYFHLRSINCLNYNLLLNEEVDFQINCYFPPEIKNRIYFNDLACFKCKNFGFDGRFVILNKDTKICFNYIFGKVVRNQNKIKTDAHVVISAAILANSMSEQAKLDEIW